MSKLRSKRNLGSLEVSSLGYGCMGLSAFYGAVSDDEGLRVLHHAMDCGITLFDTADVYGHGHNETLLGRAIKGRRDGLVIASKFGNTFDSGPKRVEGHPDYVIKACEDSLRRLNIDCIDLYYLHRVSPTTPVEDTIGAMARLVEAGKIRHIGLSEPGIGSLRRAHAGHPVAAVQNEYSLWSRIDAEAMLPVCRELGIGFVPYSPLGRGFLAGAVTSTADIGEGDRRFDLPRFQKDALPANLALVAALKTMAEEKACTLAQLALAWVMARGGDVVPIPGTRKLERLDENLAALEVDLSAGDMARLEQVFPPGVARGERYPPEGMAKTGL